LGGFGVVPGFERIQVVSIEAPVVGVDADGDVLVAEAGEHFGGGGLGGFGFAFFEEGEAVVASGADPLGKGFVGAAGFCAEFFGGEGAVIWVRPAVVADGVAGLGEGLEGGDGFALELLADDETGGGDVVKPEGFGDALHDLEALGGASAGSWDVREIVERDGDFLGGGA